MKTAEEREDKKIVIDGQTYVADERCGSLIDGCGHFFVETGSVPG